MGNDDRFKDRKAKLKRRKTETRIPKPDSFLIISEGTKTEPNYFNGLADHINEKYGKSIDVQKPTIDAKGQGMSTVRLVQEAAKIAARSRIMYKQTWILFDKDDFGDFDEAIQLCDSYHYHAGWSNQSFEYWIYLHFEYSDSALHRNEWCEKLNQIFKLKNICKEGYDKNDLHLFEHVASYGGIKNAIRNAKKIDRTYKDTIPSKCDPCTKVYYLLMELEPWIQDLL